MTSKTFEVNGKGYETNETILNLLRSLADSDNPISNDMFGFVLNTEIKNGNVKEI